MTTFSVVSLSLPATPEKNDTPGKLRLRNHKESAVEHEHEFIQPQQQQCS